MNLLEKLEKSIKDALINNAAVMKSLEFQQVILQSQLDTCRKMRESRLEEK